MSLMDVPSRNFSLPNNTCLLELNYTENENFSSPDININCTVHFLRVNEIKFRAFVAVSSLIITVGVPGNIFVSAAILLNKSLRTAVNFLVLSLSVCDLMFLSSVVPVHIYTYSTGQSPQAGLCWFVGFLTNGLLSSSTLSTGAIAINRYIAIVLSHRYAQVTKTKVVVAMIIGVYLLPVLVLSPTNFGERKRFGFKAHDRRCGWLNGGIFKVIFIFLSAVLPLIFMTFCYIRILQHVLTSRKRVATSVQRSHQTEASLSLMLAMVYIVYVATTLPSIAMQVVQHFGFAAGDGVDFLIVWASTAINPLVYGLVSKKYREAYKLVIKKIVSLTCVKRAL